jgi:hypothetical protein
VKKSPLYKNFCAAQSLNCAGLRYIRVSYVRLCLFCFILIQKLLVGPPVAGWSSLEWSPKASSRTTSSLPLAKSQYMKQIAAFEPFHKRPALSCRQDHSCYRHCPTHGSTHKKYRLTAASYFCMPRNCPDTLVQFPGPLLHTKHVCNFVTPKINAADIFSAKRIREHNFKQLNRLDELRILQRKHVIGFASLQH